MAKNITLMGADYPDVPAVQLPQTGGGTATFYDIEVIDNLNSSSTTDALSANQGRVLKEALQKQITPVDYSSEVNLSNSAITSATVTAFKLGRLVMITVRNMVISGSISDWSVIGSVGNKLKPITPMTQAAIYGTSGALYVDAQGTMKNLGSWSGNNINFTLVYIADNDN